MKHGWKKTKFPGVRYREHPTRKHGIKKDRYFVIRYQRSGKRREEGLGWASEGWTAERASIELSDLKKAHITGSGPQTLAEKRAIEKERRERREREKRRIERENITFSMYFEKTYFPVAMSSKKPGSYKAEKCYFTKWIDPVIGNIPFSGIHRLSIEKIKLRMQKCGRAQRTIEYVLAIVRQVWNMARRDGLINAECPTRFIKKPRVDNQRVRFLTYDEAEKLLEALKVRSIQTYFIALLSLHCGLRASEIFRLTWGSIDLARGIIQVDGKRDQSRPAFMTGQVKELFRSLGGGKPDALLFPDRNGRQIRRVSNVFQRTVKDLGLNDGITDRRKKIVFHSLRHTYASWLVEGGTNLYTVQKLMGHRSISMTERYSHLGDHALQSAVRRFEENISKLQAARVIAIKDLVNI